MSDAKTIFRVLKNKENPFVMLDKRPLENKELSWKAKGILAYLLSRPDNWQIQIQDLINRSTDQGASVRSGLGELQKAGHLFFRGREYEDGRIVRSLWDVYESPLLHSDFQHEENLDEENHQHSNKDSTNKDSTDMKDSEPTAAEEPGEPKLIEYQDDIKPWGDAWETVYGLRAGSERIIPAGFSTAKKGEYAFWIRGSNNTGAKGLYDFKKQGITPEMMLEAGRVANGNTGGKRFTLKNPNSLYPFALTVWKSKQRPGAESADTLKARQAKAKKTHENLTPLEVE